MYEEMSHPDWLAHYGTLHKSGRYPWMSGKEGDSNNPTTFLNTVEHLRKVEGMNNVEIARAFGLDSTTDLLALKSNARNAEKQSQIGQARRLSDKGWSNVAIGKHMGLNESSVRALLKPGELDKTKVLDNTTSMLRDAIADKKYIDVGKGVGQHMNVSSTKLSNAVKQLEGEGYELHYVNVEQLGTGKNTKLKVLTAPGTAYADVYKNRDQISLPLTYSDDGGRSYDKIQKPLSIDSSRVAVRYAEDGGTDSDGVIYIRPGVKDVSIGSAKYAQVRVVVDGTHYLKGMALYKDDLPKGTDLQFNTNKSSTGNKLDALKPVKDDPVNPFSSMVRQIGDPDPKDPNKKILTSAMNIVNDEGNWDEWSKTLSSQMLSKQTPSLAKKQLGMVVERQQNEFDKIKGLDNPEVRRKLLTGLADGADSASVNLKAAALPRTQNRVILPINSLKEDEVYAPQFRDGEQVVLIRHPHGGVFEIPQLKVNNKNPEAKKLLGDAEDAIGIHSNVAAKLSGADFDGDTVLVIPNNKKEIKTAPSLEKLKGFDPQHEYPHYPGMPEMTSRQKGQEMGNVSNLITDMTIRGATQDELASAIRHSMVVIDAEKHNLNWRQSAVDNRIAALKKKYQFKTDSTGLGASTLISRASSRLDVNERKQGYKIDPVTGRKIFTDTGKTYPKTKSSVDPVTGLKVYTETGKIVPKTERSTKLAETDDAHTLSSGRPIEEIYADHSNQLKALANQARLEALNTKSIPYSPSARVKYATQVQHLEASLRQALYNSPLERQAQIVANANIAKKKLANPNMDAAELKKLKSIELENARNRVGAKKSRIEISDDEWETIQAGAITTHRLREILDNTDLDRIKELATPKTKTLMSGENKSRALLLLRNGYTQAQVADTLGVSVSTLKRSLAEGED